MNTYQVVVIALLISVVGGAGYFATSQGVAGTAYNLISRGQPQEVSIDATSSDMASLSFSEKLSRFFKGQSATSNVDPLIASLIAGVYVCQGDDMNAGCDGDVTLSLFTKGKANMVVVYRDGAETEQQHGFWELNDVGQIMVTLTSGTEAEYKTPRVLMFNREDDGTLSLAQFVREEYPTVIKGVFSRK